MSCTCYGSGRAGDAGRQALSDIYQDVCNQRLSPDSPRQYKWHVVYCVFTALLYLAIAAGSLVFLLADPAELKMDPAEARILGVVFAVPGTVLLIPYAVAPFLPRRPWAWVVGFVLICIGTTSTCLLPVAIPLLIFWIKPQTRSYFGTTE